MCKTASIVIDICCTNLSVTVNDAENCIRTYRRKAFVKGQERPHSSSMMSGAKTNKEDTKLCIILLGAERALMKKRNRHLFFQKYQYKNSSSSLK